MISEFGRQREAAESVPGQPGLQSGSEIKYKISGLRRDKQASLRYSWFGEVRRNDSFRELTVCGVCVQAEGMLAVLLCHCLTALRTGSFSFFFFFMCGCFACIYIFVLLECLMPMEFRRGHRIP